MLFSFMATGHHQPHYTVSWTCDQIYVRLRGTPRGFLHPTTSNALVGDKEEQITIPDLIPSFAKLRTYVLEYLHT